MMSVPTLEGLRREGRLAALVALGAGLQVMEVAMPGIGPWFRPGLANMATMLALVWEGPRLALAVTGMRTVLGALAIGTLLTPTFLISLAGGLAAWMAMTITRMLPGSSPAGWGMAGGVAHISAQIAVVQMIVAPVASPWGLWPWLVPQAALAGWIVGALSGYLAGRMRGAWKP